MIKRLNLCVMFSKSIVQLWYCHAFHLSINFTQKCQVKFFKKNRCFKLVLKQFVFRAVTKQSEAQYVEARLNVQRLGNIFEN